MECKIGDQLKRLNLISGDKCVDVFNQLYPDILQRHIPQPSDFISTLWEKYEPNNVSLNGLVFEGLIATCLYRHAIKPVYVQSKLAFIPNVNFDFVVYTKEHGPIVLSAKTSLRERYKQADLEGMMLKQVHRRSKSFLITMNNDEAASVSKKIENGEVLGLDKVIHAASEKFDDLISELSGYKIIKPPPVAVITSTRLIE